LYIQFFPTLRCNESCSFCFNRGITAGPDVEVRDFSKIVNRLTDNGIREIDLLGGEPTRHPELVALIDIACTKGLSVSLSTNGSDIGTLKGLYEKFGPDQLTTGISLNGRTVDEAFTSFIEKHKPLLKTVSTARHFLSASLARFLDLPGIRHYAIFMDTLNTSDLKEGLSFPDFYSSLKEHQAKYNSLEGVYCSGFIPETSGRTGLDKVRCPAGTAKLSIMPDGAVYPCYLLFMHPEFSLGNILEDDFGDVLDNPVLDFFTMFEKNNCPDTDCRHHHDCHGGCPALSLALNGDLNAPDPRCLNQTRA
jgi:radical SAM protein with 4Fe4S-binding SPASM domain